MGRVAFIRAAAVFFLLTSICSAEALPAPREVTLSAADGTKLKGTFFASHKTGPGVLLLHQCNRQRGVWEDLAKKLSASGINVFTFDLRGFGESGGERYDKLTPQQEGQTELQLWPGDIDAAFQYLVSQPEVTRNVIGVGGASCGVNNAIQAARRHSEVKSLVLLSGNTNFDGRQFLRNSPNLPVFFAVADDDEFKPIVTAIEWLYSLSPNPGKKFVHYTNGGHGADMFAPHPELPGLIVDWFVTTLVKTPGHAPVSRELQPIPQEVQTLDLIDQPGGPAKVMRMLVEARQKDPKASLFREDLVNYLGYEHAQAGDKKGAIEILKLNVAAYPNSPNTYDSLSDAYLGDGQNDLARQNAKKALELLQSDTTDPEQLRNGIRANVERKLKQLGDETR
ncbi:MAG: alpha/beta hydrolase [Acidobacteriales bacterium]|nr:alpha/beta hydrolase [Terriglobales bacterium]